MSIAIEPVLNRLTMEAFLAPERADLEVVDTHIREVYEWLNQDASDDNRELMMQAEGERTEKLLILGAKLAQLSVVGTTIYIHEGITYDVLRPDRDRRMQRHREETDLSGRYGTITHEEVYRRGGMPTFHAALPRQGLKRYLPSPVYLVHSSEFDFTIDPPSYAFKEWHASQQTVQI